MFLEHKADRRGQRREITKNIPEQHTSPLQRGKKEEDFVPPKGFVFSKIVSEGHKNEDV